MEKWLADRPHHPGEAAKQWLKDLYQHNKLVKSEFELGGRKVDLAEITMPVLNIYAQERPHHSAADLAGAGRAGRHQGLQRDRPAGRPRRRVRQRQVAGRARQGHRRLAARAPVDRSRRVECAKIAPRFEELPGARAARLHARRLHRMGTARRAAHGGLRPRPDAQQPRLRFPRRSDWSSAACAWSRPIFPAAAAAIPSACRGLWHAALRRRDGRV